VSPWWSERTRLFLGPEGGWLARLHGPDAGRSLAAFPSLVLDGFSFKRNNIGATAAAAELHLSFYLRP